MYERTFVYFDPCDLADEGLCEDCEMIEYEGDGFREPIISTCPADFYPDNANCIWSQEVQEIVSAVEALNKRANELCK